MTKDEYAKGSDVLAVLSKYYKDVVGYSPRQERLMVMLKNDIMALEPASVMPIVRCQECEYSREPDMNDRGERAACADTLICSVGFDHVYPCTGDDAIFVDKDWFCGEGRPKEHINENN